MNVKKRWTKIILLNLNLHEDGDGGNDGIMSGGFASNSLFDGGWAWARTMLGKGLSAGTAWVTVPGDPTCGWDEAAEQCGAILGATGGTVWLEKTEPMPLNISPVRVFGTSKKGNLTTVEQNNASICVIFLGPW